MSRNSDFGTFGRYTELQLDEMTADQRKAYEFTVGQRREVPGTYKAWLQNPVVDTDSEQREAAGPHRLAALGQGIPR